MTMKDLTFFHDGNRTRMDGLINVDKLRKMVARAADIQALGQIPYTFKEDPAVQNYLSHSRRMPMERMQAISELIEPRET